MILLNHHHRFRWDLDKLSEEMTQNHQAAVRSEL
eukprot:SAG31_NODE_43178_length_268_cov_0.615385_2_plen_33_part_01